MNHEINELAGGSQAHKNDEPIKSILENVTSQEELYEIKHTFFEHLDPQSRDEFLQIVAGTRLPELTSDVIAKLIFDPDTHPERLNFLLQHITKDDDFNSKQIILDIPSMFKNGRPSNTMIHATCQDFIFHRWENFGSDLARLQYPENTGLNKEGISFENVPGVLIVVLMKESPNVFRKFKSDRYIHRFNRMAADSGLTCGSLVDIVYVELEKCLNQFNAGKDGENDHDLQIILAAIADINNPKLKSSDLKLLDEIVRDVREKAASKETQTMLLAEKYADADYNAVLSCERKQERDSIFQKSYLIHGPVETAELFDISVEEVEAKAKRFGIFQGGK